MRRSTPNLLALAAAVALPFIAGGCSGCKCGKKEDPPPVVQPPRGQATNEELSTGIGQARALDEGLAPTSAQWRRTFVLDDKRAILVGEVGTDAVAILTDDAGKSWKPLKAERDSWANWNVSNDGNIALAVGSRAGAKAQTGGTIETTSLFFATFDAPQLTAPMPLFPTPKGPVKGLLDSTSAVPVLLGDGLAAIVGEESPRKQTIFYGGKPGSEAIPPLSLPTGEKVVPVAYGQPPILLSIKGRDLFQRPFPTADKPFEKKGQKVPGIVATPTLLAELSSAPVCSAAGFSLQRVKQPKGPSIVAIGPDKAAVITLPPNVDMAAPIACNKDRFVVLAADVKVKAIPTTGAPPAPVPTLIVCEIATGKCTPPENPPFRVWPEQHERRIVAIPVDQGVLAMMESKAGERWGLYLAQAPEGNIYERPRAVAEGQSDRGRVSFGAMVAFGKRAVLLLTAEVAGTNHRGWFVTVSDDGGNNWASP